MNIKKIYIDSSMGQSTRWGGKYTETKQPYMMDDVVKNTCFARRLNYRYNFISIMWNSYTKLRFGSDIHKEE